MSFKQQKVVESKVTIKIPRKLYNRLAEIVEGSGFNSVTDFIVFVLRDLASAPGQIEIPKKQELDQENRLTTEEIEVIRKRLKSLGYL